MRARYYDPSIGRFISRDSIEGDIMQPQTQNAYSFVVNNPMANSDPSGMLYLDIGVSSGLIGPFGAGGGLQINDQGVTPYVSAGAITPGKGVTATLSAGNPEPNKTTVSFAGTLLGPAASVSFPAEDRFVYFKEGQLSVGVGYPAGASMTLNRTLGTYCW
jgi:uncharacterized protein RhaS with RHS repeats